MSYYRDHKGGWWRFGLHGAGISWTDRGIFYFKSVNQTRKALTSPMRMFKGRVQIKIDKVWMNLCRTDLMDDVGTYCTPADDLEKIRKYYLDGVVFGARVKKDKFFVIDAMSDG